MPAKPLLLVCDRCGATFEAASLNIRFCSRHCTLVAENELPHCIHCGRRFMPRSGNQGYCSEKCALEGRRARNREAYRRHQESLPAKPEMHAKCEWCGEEYVKKYHLQRYCGRECAQLARTEYIKQRVAAIGDARKDLREKPLRGKARQEYINLRTRDYTDAQREERLAALEAQREELANAPAITFSNCAHCGEPYDPNDADARGDYCSERCEQRAKEKRAREKRKGKGAPRWPALYGCLWCGHEMRAVDGHAPESCPRCGRREFEALRRCHDCGKVLPDGAYRCPDCLAKWKKKHGVPESGSAVETYGVASW